MAGRSEDNKTLVRTFFDAVTAGDFAIFDQIVAADYNDHLAGQRPGRENLKLYFRGLRSAFPDLKLPVAAIVAEGDLVAVMNSIRGTHKGEYAGLKPTGKSVDVMAFQLYRITNNQIAEHWEVADFATMMRQLQN